MTKTSETALGKRRGRHPGSKNIATMVRERAMRKVTIRDAAGPREVTVLRALILRLQYKAIRGDLRADKRLDALRDRAELAIRNRPGVLVVPGMMDEAEWVRQEEIANIFRQPPEPQTPQPGPGYPIGDGSADIQTSAPRLSRQPPQPPNPWRGRLIR